MLGPEQQGEAYGVRLAKQAFTFSAAHFITFNGDTCERLHGHNYRVALELWGPLDENAYVNDFVATRDALAAVVADLDHRVLLPTLHPLIRVESTEGEVIATFRERRWVFPLGDCRLLEVSNTTAEQLARWIALRLLAAFKGLGWAPPAELRVEVDECEGQVGVCRM